jgi:hypothetical protein
MNKILLSLKNHVQSIISIDWEIVKHFIGGLLATIIITVISGSLSIGLACSMIIGFFKELYDLLKAGISFNPMHMAADCSGALIGGLIFLLYVGITLL